MADGLVIETADLRKTYNGVDALRGLNLQVPAGSICGFLGRNGAGKTTTIKILMGMARPTSGGARVFGLQADRSESSVEIRRRTGFVSDDKDLYDSMTVDEMIRFTAPFFPRWRADLAARYLQTFELPRTRKVKALSRGMRTKLALLLLPSASLAVQLTVVAPSAKVLSEGGVQVTSTVPLTRSFALTVKWTVAPSLEVASFAGTSGMVITGAVVSVTVTVKVVAP